MCSRFNNLQSIQLIYWFFQNGVSSHNEVDNFYTSQTPNIIKDEAELIFYMWMVVLSRQYFRPILQSWNYQIDTHYVSLISTHFMTIFVWTLTIACLFVWFILTYLPSHCCSWFKQKRNEKLWVTLCALTKNAIS